MNNKHLLPLLFTLFSVATFAQSKIDENSFIEESTISHIISIAPIETVKDHELNFVNVYPNELVESFVIDFYDKDFSIVTVIVKDESGKTVYASDLRDISAGDFTEINLPKDLDREVVYVTIIVDGEELVKIFNV